MRGGAPSCEHVNYNSAAKKPEAGGGSMSGSHGSEASLEDCLASDDVVYCATQIFDALSDFTRFQILSSLVMGERSVSDLQEVCHVSQSAISHQLRLLRDRGLVTSRRRGQRVFYRLTDEHVAVLIRVGLSHAAEAEPGDSED